MNAAPWARVLLFVVPALWSSNYIVARSWPGHLGPHLLASGRWALALALMLPFVGAALWRRRATVRAEWKQCLVLGALGMWICGALLYVAGQSTSASNLALFYAATPVLIAVAGVKLLHEKMSGAQRAGVALAAAGVVFVICKGDPRNLLAVRLSVGDGWALLCAASWVAYSVLLQRWRSALGPAERLAAIIAGGLVVLLPFTLAEGLAGAWPPFGWQGAALIVTAAVLPGVLSYTAYSYLQRELGASRTALMLYLSPIYSALLAWVLLGERPAWYHAAGAALILPSIALATRRTPA